MTKNIGPFFIVMSSVTSHMKQFIGVHKLIWKLLWNLQEHSFSDYDVIEVKSFRKKAIVQAKKKLSPFFSHIVECETSVDNFQGCKRCSDNYCGSYKIISVTPKKLLKTQLFEKKGNFLSEKKIEDFFSYYRVWEASRSTL